MRIGVLTGSMSRQAGGLFWSVRQLARSTQEAGCRVDVFAAEDADSSRDLMHWDGLNLQVLEKRGPAAFGYMPGLMRSLKQSDPDLLHTHGIWMYPSLAVLQWSRRTGRPFLISPRGMLDPWAVNNSAWKKRLVSWLYEDAHLRGAACLHALSQSEAEAIRAYGLRNPICIIPNGIDPPALEPVEPPKWQAYLPENAKVLLYLGRLHPKKGLFNLLTAWAMARRFEKSAADWRLVIAGWDQGGHEDELKSLVHQQGIQNSVLFVGAQFDQAKHASYGRADAFILPSLSEGLPMAVLEAWSYCLPVLMTPHCNLPEGYSAKAALRIEPERIAPGLIALFAMTEEERVTMGQRGRILVDQQFGWANIAQEMLAVYRWVIKLDERPDCVSVG